MIIVNSSLKELNQLLFLVLKIIVQFNLVKSKNAFII